MLMDCSARIVKKERFIGSQYEDFIKGECTNDSLFKNANKTANGIQDFACIVNFNL